MQQNFRRAAWLGIWLLASGCGDSTPGMRTWGSVSYQGQPIESGQIIFIPIDGTPGPSTGGPVANGQYDIAKKVGPYAGGKYRVEITAFGPEKTYTPNASGVGMSATVPVQLLPANYNRSSTLRAEISKNAGENQHDFDLP